PVTPSWRSSTSTTSASSDAPREMTNVSAIRTVAIRASSSTADTLEPRMRTLATYLRGLDPHLPRMVWLVQVGGVVNAFGNGIVFPFAIIYLHNVRGISFAQAGFALAIGGAGARSAHQDGSTNL